MKLLVKAARRSVSPAPRALASLACVVDRAIGWERLPVPLGILLLIGIRSRLRQRNLYDTRPPPSRDPPEPAMGRPANLLVRTADGSYNDLQDPTLGSIGSRYGRNVPLKHAWPEPYPDILKPSPREISRQLLTREWFIPATNLNLLAAAWLHFETEDWFSHGPYEREDPWQIDIDESDSWPSRRLLIPRTRRDPTYDPDGEIPPTFVSNRSHWRDASQIYGTTEEEAQRLRTGEDGKLRVEDGVPPMGADAERVVEWIGLALLRLLFSLEHNAVCDRLRKDLPRLSDDQLFQRARLVIAALIMKIHSVEWVPAMMGHPTTVAFNWGGITGAGSTRHFRRLSAREIISGIPGSRPSHHGVPYSLTEELIAVSRMYPLLPDDFEFRSVDGDDPLAELPYRAVSGVHMRPCLQRVSVINALYSMGIAHPGIVTLHNFPRSLQQLELADDTLVDLGASDIIGIRERGVPRYNEFRRLFHRRPVRSFEELTDNPTWADELRLVYGGDIDRVDLMIGLYSEPRPPGFPISDTAFRVLFLMASRHLKSDRYITPTTRREPIRRPASPGSTRTPCGRFCCGTFPAFNQRCVT